MIPLVNTEEDVLYRLAQTSPAHVVVVDGATRNGWPGDEVPHVDAGVPQACVFVQHISTIDDPHMPTHLLQIMVRGEKGQRAAAFAKARALANGIGARGSASARFIGKSGARYSEVRIGGVRSAGPDESSSIPYFFVDLEVVQVG
jgi:hypothetical protein